MPKFLCEVRYGPEGLQGLHKDGAATRKAVVQKAIKSLGGKLESFYFTFGERDLVLIADLPDNVTAAALSMTVGETGMVHLNTTPMLTVEEVDKAIKAKKLKYTAPGA